MFRINPIDLQNREGRQKFYQAKEWRALSLVKLTESTWCEKCLKEGIYTLVTEVDHIIDICKSSARFMDITNLLSLCQPITHQRHSKSIRKTPDLGRRRNIKWLT
jgi:5-methylcytosine-specific restriction endonuclease McrA